MSTDLPLEVDEVRAALVEAVRHALRRCQTEPEFRFHMLHTETFEKLCAAEALVSGTPIAEVRELCSRDMQPSYRRREPRCEQDHERVQELEDDRENLVERLCSTCRTEAERLQTERETEREEARQKALAEANQMKLPMEHAS